MFETIFLKLVLKINEKLQSITMKKERDVLKTVDNAGFIYKIKIIADCRCHATSVGLLLGTDNKKHVNINRLVLPRDSSAIASLRLPFNLSFQGSQLMNAVLIVVSSVRILIKSYYRPAFSFKRK